MVTRILAFDLGQHMAFASSVGREVADHASFKGTRAQRASQTLAWLLAIRQNCEEHDIWPDVVVYERPFARGLAATRALWGIAGLIEAVWGDVTAVMDLTPAEIKKRSTGGGAGDKQAMLRAAQARGYTGDNEHEADAWCLMRVAQDTFTVEKPNGGQIEGRGDRRILANGKELSKRFGGGALDGEGAGLRQDRTPVSRGKKAHRRQPRRGRVRTSPDCPA